MKILHVLNHSVPHTDGYCVRSEHIVRFQKNCGWDPIVVTSPKQEPIPTESVETIHGIRYFRTLPKQSQVPLPSIIKSIWQVKRRIEEVILQERPDIIHSHSPCTWGYAALKAAKRFSLPFVYEVRGIWEDGAVDQGRLKETSLEYRLRRAMESYVARKATSLVVISSGLEKEFQLRGAKDIFMVPNGVDLDKFNVRQNGIREKETITIGYIGSLYSWEGVDDLVRAASIMRITSPDIQVQIVGGGEMERTLRDLIDKHSLSGTVCMLGRVPHEEITSAYENIDILAYPRRSSRTTELVTPLKPLEAMAQKKPIVVSDVGGLMELVGNDSASVFAAGDPEDLARKCLELVGNADLRRRLGQNAHKHVHLYRNWASIIEIYNKVYQHALADSNRLRRTGINHLKRK